MLSILFVFLYNIENTVVGIKTICDFFKLEIAMNMAKKPVNTPPMFPDMHVEPIQASTVIIIHPGSMFLRIGRASDAFPHAVPHVIARRNRQQTVSHRDSLLMPLAELSPEATASLEEIQMAINTVLASCLTGEGRLRYSVPIQNVTDHNLSAKPKVLKPISEVSWTKTNGTKDVLVGEEVLYLNPSENYHIHWPIRRGQLNIHSDVGGSLSAVLSDLEAIWKSALQQYLSVSTKDFKMYRAVLVIPDVYKRDHVKHLVQLLLVRLGFASCFVHLESICASFGAGLSCACVVDVGDQKTSVCCVEDGISHRSSRLCMEYGGSDITQLFYWLEKKCYLPYHFSTDCSLDAVFLQELKENFCHVNLDVCGAQDRSFVIKKPNVPTFQYDIKVGDECLIAPLALFHPELFGITGPKSIRTQQRAISDAEDPHDEQYLIQTQRRGMKDVSEGPAEQSMNDESHANLSVVDEDIDSTDPPTIINTKESEIDLLYDQLLGVDQAIVQSVESCDSDELKRKMYSCILVIGGGMMFTGIHTWLQNRLSVQIPVVFRSEPINIITRPKDMDPRITTWKGAAVMSCLDTAQELWISQKEWLRCSVKILRERAPFSW